MMGGLAVAWQVKVTLSPSRTERGSMDRVTMGGSTQEKQHMINVNVLSSGSSRTIDFSTQICHTNYKLNHNIWRFKTPFHCLERRLLLYSRCGCSGIMKKNASVFFDRKFKPQPPREQSLPISSRTRQKTFKTQKVFCSFQMLNRINCAALVEKDNAEWMQTAKSNLDPAQVWECWKMGALNSDTQHKCY